jgi:hypothetical protein
VDGTVLSRLKEIKSAGQNITYAGFYSAAGQILAARVDAGSLCVQSLEQEQEQESKSLPAAAAVSICACCAPSLSLENMFDLDHGLSHNLTLRASLCIPCKSKTLRALDGMSWTRDRHGSGPEVRGLKLASLTGNLPSAGEYWLRGVLTAAKGHRIEL